ncbi:uncharacterized [Tachysurus ichikawai]
MFWHDGGTTGAAGEQTQRSSRAQNPIFLMNFSPLSARGSKCTALTWLLVFCEEHGEPRDQSACEKPGVMEERLQGERQLKIQALDFIRTAVCWSCRDVSQLSISSAWRCGMNLGSRTYSDALMRYDRLI